MQQNLLLELDGQPAGRFFKAEGGNVKADVVTERIVPGGPARKHLAGVRVEDLKLTCGTGMSRTFYDWLGTNLSGPPMRKDGAVIALATTQKPVSRIEFMHALVTSLELPALERSANKDAYMNVSLSPEMTRLGSADPNGKMGVYVAAQQKAWNIGSFRLRISGLESDCSHVARIGPLTMSQNVKTDVRTAEKHPTSRHYSDLVVQLSDTHADGFYRWFDDFVVKGNNDSSAERTGTLEFFAPSSTKAYFVVTFSGLGVFAAESQSAVRSKSVLPVTFRMYCESMAFAAGPAAVA